PGSRHGTRRPSPAARGHPARPARRTVERRDPAAYGTRPHPAGRCGVPAPRGPSARGTPWPPGGAAPRRTEKGVRVVSGTDRPEDGYGSAARIRAGILAFACGDALGVPWENRPVAEIDAARLDELPQRPGWPRGATS